MAAARGLRTAGWTRRLGGVNTGATCSPPACFHPRRRPVLRPAIAVPIPARNGVSLLLDGGANADNRPEHLLQFGVMGAVFSEEILGVATRSSCPFDRGA